MSDYFPATKALKSTCHELIKTVLGYRCNKIESKNMSISRRFLLKFSDTKNIYINMRPIDIL